MRHEKKIDWAGRILCLVLFFWLCSCSQQKRINNAKHLIEDNGGLVLLDKNKLPATCDSLFPCVSVESEIKDSSWITKDSANKLIQKALREATKDLRNDTIKITDSASCMRAAEHYRQKIKEAADRIDDLIDNIKETETIYNLRLEKQKIESTAKLAALQNDFKHVSDQLAAANAVIVLKDKEIAARDATIKQYKSDEKDIVYVLKLLLKILWPWLAVGGGLLLIWKYRGLIPILNRSPLSK